MLHACKTHCGAQWKGTLTCAPLHVCMCIYGCEYICVCVPVCDVYVCLCVCLFVLFGVVCVCVCVYGVCYVVCVYECGVCNRLQITSYLIKNVKSILLTILVTSSK